jgi:anti-sigma factor RsiW
MSVAHTDVGAYALGLLNDDDRAAFEEHLHECASCARELGDLVGLRRMLTGIGPIQEPEVSEEGRGRFAELLERRRTAERRRRRNTVVIGLAAGIVVVAGGVTAGSFVTGHGQAGGHRHGSPAAEVLAHGERHSATDPATHAVGTVATRPTAWGTEVGLDLGNVRGPLTCRLVAVTRSGRQQPVTDWAVPPKGYGVPGSRADLQVHGGTSVRRGDIVRFEVRIDGGGRLLSIPV